MTKKLYLEGSTNPTQSLLRIHLHCRQGVGTYVFESKMLDGQPPHRPHGTKGEITDAYSGD